MNLAVNPGIVAAVVILAVELVIVVVVIGFLLCKGRKGGAAVFSTKL